MKLTKGPDSPQSGEGTTHEVRSLPTKVRGADKGTDNAPVLQDMYISAGPCLPGAIRLGGKGL